MQFSCDTCRTRYAIADDRIRGKKVRVRCKKCGSPILLEGSPATPQPGTGGEPLADARLESSQPVTTAFPPEAEHERAEWFVAISGVEVGPVTRSHLRQRIVSGEVVPRTYVWRDGMLNWARIKDVPELAGLLPSLPPQSTRGPPIADRAGSTAAAIAKEESARAAALNLATEPEESASTVEVPSSGADERAPATGDRKADEAGLQAPDPGHHAPMSAIDQPTWTFTPSEERTPVAGAIPSEEPGRTPSEERAPFADATPSEEPAPAESPLPSAGSKPAARSSARATELTPVGVVTTAAEAAPVVNEAPAVIEPTSAAKIASGPEDLVPAEAEPARGESTTIADAMASGAGATSGGPAPSHSAESLSVVPPPASHTASPKMNAATPPPPSADSGGTSSDVTQALPASPPAGKKSGPKALNTPIAELFDQPVFSPEVSQPIEIRNDRVTPFVPTPVSGPVERSRPETSSPFELGEKTRAIFRDAAERKKQTKKRRPGRVVALVALMVLMAAAAGLWWHFSSIPHRRPPVPVATTRPSQRQTAVRERAQGDSEETAALAAALGLDPNHPGDAQVASSGSDVGVSKPRKPPFDASVVPDKEKAIQPRMQSCVAEALRRHDEFTIGTDFMIKATIEPSGNIGRVTFSHRDQTRTWLGRCLKRAVRSMHFAAFDGEPQPLEIPLTAYAPL